MIAQLLLLREICVALGGNELVYGFALGAWLLLVAVGAWLTGRLGTRLRLGLSSYLLTLAGGGILAPVSILLVRCARWLWVGESGAALPVGSVALATFAVMAPLCLTLGAFFAIASAISMRSVTHPTQGASRVYVFESIGAFVGGLLFTTILIRSFDALAIAMGVAAANCIAAFVAWCHTDRRAHRWGWGLAPAAVVLVVCLATPLCTILDFASQAFSLRGETLTVSQETDYGRVAVTQTANDMRIYESGALVSATKTERRIEERAYVALLAHPKPLNVLVIGGSLTNIVRGALNTSRLNVYCVELDPGSVNAGWRCVPWPHPAARALQRARVLNQVDGRTFVKHAPERYDAIVSLLPNPGTGLINRYYTADFFAEARAALGADGVLLVGLDGAYDHMSAAQRALAASVHESLRSVFETVTVLPADDAILFVASRTATPGFPHVEHWPNRLAALGLKPAWLTPETFASMTDAGRMAALRSAIAGARRYPINTDLRPVAYATALLSGSERMQPGTATALRTLFGLDLPGVLLIVAILTGLLCLSATFAPTPLKIGVPATCAYAGASGLLLELVLLFAYQGLYGTAYSQMGILFAAFMVGTTLGAAVSRHLELARSELKMLMLLQAAMAVLAALAVPALAFLGAAEPWASRLGAVVVMPLINMCAGALVGAQFPVAVAVCTPSVRTTGETALTTRLYAAELGGACAGALIGTLILVPALGLYRTCWTVSVLCLATLPLLLLSERRRP